MNTKTILGVVGGLIIGFFIGSALIYSVYETDSYGRGWMMGGGRGGGFGGRGGGMMGGNIDQHFIEQMIPHHDGAIEMAKLALERSKRPEILSLANGIIEAQTRENTSMRAWYRAWFGGDVPVVQTGGMMMHMDSMQGNIEGLKAAKDFDLEFIRQMVPHHQMAIMMASMLDRATERPEMKTLADQIITSQAREIKMMQSWAEAWSK